MHVVVFSDLDGTLLDHDSYSWAPAERALNLLKQRHIPLILISSKTMPEIQRYRDELNLHHPVVAENGAFIDIPNNYFSHDAAQSVSYTSRHELQQHLSELRTTLSFDALSFSELGVKGIAKVTGLDEEKARLANQRQASEPLWWRDSEEKLEQFTQAAHARGLGCVRGGRFVHLMTNSDKSVALRKLTQLYCGHWSVNHVQTVALGDGPNDLDMLKAADIAVVIPGQHEHDMDMASHGRVIRPARAGPSGWNEAMLALLEEI